MYKVLGRSVLGSSAHQSWCLVLHCATAVVQHSAEASVPWGCALCQQAEWQPGVGMAECCSCWGSWVLRTSCRHIDGREHHQPDSHLLVALNWKLCSALSWRSDLYFCFVCLVVVLTEGSRWSQFCVSTGSWLFCPCVNKSCVGAHLFIFS